MLHAVIMAGGTGTRFWPLSRAARPKQLLDLTGGRTMIQATVDRLGDLAPAERTWIITNRSLVWPIAEQLPELGSLSDSRRRIIGEPCKRDTAPAIGLAALLLLSEDADATMIVMPADHLIQPSEAFQAAISQAAGLVEREPQTLATFGIKPTYAAESFGYIERGDGVQGSGFGVQGGGDRGQGTGDGAEAAVYGVKKFREKPAKSVAEEYLASGNFYWNSGIFVWKARTILDALEKYEPAICDHLEVIQNHIGKPEYADVFDREFTAIRGKSIDFAVMEHYQPVVVIEAPFTWDDVGSWQALARSVGADESGNTVIGKHVGIRTSGSIVRGDSEHLIVTLGIRDAIVVHTPDATLVADKQQEEAIREVVKALEERGWREYL
jgi:mannose-1-phosphate guanylyltransferase